MMNWTTTPSKELDIKAENEAKTHQSQLTKPAGSLGQLETIATRLAAMQSTPYPRIEAPHITIFAADHGIASEGVSAFPQVVTGEMIHNFARGGAAINVLAKAQNATLTVVNCGTIHPIEPLNDVVSAIIAAGTDNFLHAAAMSAEQCAQALAIGKHAVDSAIAQGADIFIAGEMGIANTTSATAIACALLNRPASNLVGKGTGINETMLIHKTHIIEQALRFHKSALISPLSILQHLGGFEIAAMTGAYLTCAKAGIPVIIDGFISCAAALVAIKHQPDTQNWMIFSHTSAEEGHALLIRALNATPLLNLGMRLGEGSGAATALGLIKLACDLHNTMATFAQAGVSDNSVI